jgi:hypothetical protein
LHAGQDIRIHIHRGLDALVAESFLHHVNRNTACKKSVAQVGREP